MFSSTHEQKPSICLHWLIEAAWQLILPGAYFVLVLRFYPQWNAFWIYSTIRAPGSAPLRLKGRISTVCPPRRQTRTTRGSNEVVTS